MLTDYRLWQRDYLLEISRALTSQLDLKQVLRLILEYAVELVGGKGGLAALAQPDGSYRVAASYGLPAPMLSLLDPLFSEFTQNAPDSLHWTAPDLQARLNQIARAAGVSLRQVVGLPMMVQDMLVGTVYVFRSEGMAFTITDRRVLSAFAGQAAIAVHNARLYHQVTQEKQRLDAILENSGDGIMILDPQQRITVFNRALTMMTGIAAQDALGKFCWQVLSLHDHPPAVTVCDQCPLSHCRGGEQFYAEGDFFKADGTRITFGVTYSPLFDRENSLINIIANVRDITHFREAEEMKSTFISVVSHELRTPVALIKGYADVLRREDVRWDEETVRESLNVIDEESDRLAGLIDNLLDVSRMQAGQIKLNKSEVRLDLMAQRAVNDFRTQTRFHTFVLDFVDFPPVQADYERIRQVLTNLLSNAIKYSPQGGQIMVSGRFDDEFVYVAVTDQGIGIPQREQERIFDRFYRVESTLSRRTRGAGLGLYLVRSVIEAHGGRVWVESSPGHGSTFVFTLPRSGKEQEGDDRMDG